MIFCYIHIFLSFPVRCFTQYLLHFRVDSLTHLRPTVTHQNRTVFVDVDQSCSLPQTKLN